MLSTAAAAKKQRTEPAKKQREGARRASGSLSTMWPEGGSPTCIMRHKLRIGAGWVKKRPAGAHYMSKCAGRVSASSHPFCPRTAPLLS